MLDLFGPTLLLHCSSHRFIVQRKSRFGRTVGTSIVRRLDADATLPAQSAHQLHQHFLQQLAATLGELDVKGGVVDVVVPDTWCRLFVTIPPSNMTSRADCTAAVAMRFQTLYGESATEWRLQADWHVHTPFLCAAMPMALHRDLLAILRARKLRIARLVPEAVAAVNRCCRAVRIGDWFAQIGESALTLIVRDGTQIRHIVQQQLTASAQLDADWLINFAQREVLRRNGSIPGRIACAGEVPSAWLKGDDRAEPDADANVHRPQCFLIAEKSGPASVRRDRMKPADAAESATRRQVADSVKCIG